MTSTEEVLRQHDAIFRINANLLTLIIFDYDVSLSLDSFLLYRGLSSTNATAFNMSNELNCNLDTRSLLGVSGLPDSYRMLNPSSGNCNQRSPTNLIHRTKKSTMTSTLAASPLTPLRMRRESTLSCSIPAAKIEVVDLIPNDVITNTASSAAYNVLPPQSPCSLFSGGVVLFRGNGNAVQGRGWERARSELVQTTVQSSKLEPIRLIPSMEF